MTGLEVEGKGRKKFLSPPCSSHCTCHSSLSFFRFQDGVQDKYTTELSFKSMPKLLGKLLERKIHYFACLLYRLATILVKAFLSSGSFDVKALRAFRVLRPLRLVSGVPSKCPCLKYL